MGRIRAGDDWNRITDNDVLVMYTVYEHPSDQPNSFVVRRWLLIGGRRRDGGMRLALTLAEARRLLPRGLYCLGRDADDDPVIVETWL